MWKNNTIASTSKTRNKTNYTESQEWRSTMKRELQFHFMAVTSGVLWSHVNIAWILKSESKEQTTRIVVVVGAETETPEK